MVNEPDSSKTARQERDLLRGHRKAMSDQRSTHNEPITPQSAFKDPVRLQPLGKDNETLPPRASNFEEDDFEDTSDVFSTVRPNSKGKDKSEYRRQMPRASLLEHYVDADEDYLILTTTDEDGEIGVESVQTPERFLELAKQDPTFFFDKMRTSFVEANEYKQKIKKLTQRVKEGDKNLDELQDMIEEANTKNEALIEKQAKLRNLVTTLNQEKKRLTEKLAKQPRPSLTDDNDNPDDSDEENDDPFKQRPAVRANQAPRLDDTVGTNSKFPDLHIFKGEKREWHRWIGHLRGKLRASSASFPNERAKIDYIKVKLEGPAYETVKARCDEDSNNPYRTAEEMIAALKNMYADFDPVATAQRQFEDPEFPMKDNERFEDFIVRFMNVAAALDLPERQLKSELYRKITSNFRYKLAAMDTTSDTFSQYTERLRLLDIQYARARALDDKHRKPNIPKGRGSTPSTSTSEQQNSQTIKRKKSWEHSYEAKGKLFKDGRCFKCLQKGHKANDLNAPCRGKARATKEEAAQILKSINIVESSDTDEPKN